MGIETPRFRTNANVCQLTMRLRKMGVLEKKKNYFWFCQNKSDLVVEYTLPENNRTNFLPVNTKQFCQAERINTINFGINIMKDEEDDNIVPEGQERDNTSAEEGLTM
jgi:hypothetical protein